VENIYIIADMQIHQMGDIIQFASGLDLIGGDMDGKLLVSYGISDCELASIFLNMDYVQGLLHEVKDGDEVLNMIRSQLHYLAQGMMSWSCISHQ